MNFNKVIFRDCKSGTSAHFIRLHVRSSMKSTLDFLRANTDAENSRPGLGPQLGLKIRRGGGGGGEACPSLGSATGYLACTQDEQAHLTIFGKPFEGVMQPRPVPLVFVTHVMKTIVHVESANRFIYGLLH